LESMGNVMRSATALWGLFAFSAQVSAAQNIGAVSGTVRDTAGVPVAEAEIILASKRVQTNSRGEFRLDSIPIGNHLITIRMVGYAPVRSALTVQSGVRHDNYILRAIAQALPTVYVEANRIGLYGTVADSSMKPLSGVKVHVAGRGGSEVLTDANGQFAFPSVREGHYMVRITHLGHAERRVFVEIRKGEGVELSIQLQPSRAVPSLADEVAINDLSRRIVANLRADRFNANQLIRYGSLGLCDVKGVVARLGARNDGLTIILNGSVVMENMSVRDLCSWHADEVVLVEFGNTVCRDVTRTLVDMLNAWCTSLTKPPPDRSPGAMRAARDEALGEGGGRIKTQRQGGPFVVIWERR